MSIERKNPCPLEDDCTWKEWSQHILAELVRLNEGHGEAVGQLREIHIELARLKVRSSIWGAAMGALSTATLALGIWLWDYLKGGAK